MPLTSVPVGSLPYERFEPILPEEQHHQLVAAVHRAGKVFDGRVLWNINSTARGGGVVAMLVSLLAYSHGAGVDARWEVIGGDPVFFALTKRIHNRLHSANGDGGALGEREREIYETTLRPESDELVERVGRRDIVVVHDPQPAGLIPALKRLGVPVIWRCHVGVDTPSDFSREAWNFLRPYIEPADAYIFSRDAFVWDGLDPSKVHVIAPVIDAFSPKNQDLDSPTVNAILAAAGLDGHRPRRTARFLRLDGSSGTVTGRAVMN